MQKIRVMFSSRCNTLIKGKPKNQSLSQIRKQLKTLFQNAQLFDESLFEVWISEEPTDASVLESSWDECMSQVEKADIVVCIYTGEGGWAKNQGDIGICHGELETAFNKEPAKVFIINASAATTSKIDHKDPLNQKMAAFVGKINRFYNIANNAEEIITIAQKISVDALMKLAKMGKVESRKGKYNFGEALDWARMNFFERKLAIEQEIIEQFCQSGHQRLANSCINYQHQQFCYLFKIHGIPSGMNVSSAKEMVGQPFLQDHSLVLSVDSAFVKSCGPIHLIGVNKGVTEKQAINILGHPDAVVVVGAFGIYLADKIQNIQMVFFANCRDSASTRHNVQKFIDWLQESGEEDDFFKRGKSRKAIIDVINQQMSLANK